MQVSASFHIESTSLVLMLNKDDAGIIYNHISVSELTNRGLPS